MTTAHDILIGGQRVAEVRHTGFFGGGFGGMAGGNFP